VVWNIFFFPICWEESSQLTNIFFRGVETTNQPLVVWKRRSFSQRLSLAALFQGFRRFSQRSGEMAADGQEG